MEEQYNGETQAQVLILVQKATRYVVLGKQISLLTLFASGKTNCLSGSYIAQRSNGVPKFLNLNLKKKLARLSEYTIYRWDSCCKIGRKFKTLFLSKSLLFSPFKRRLSKVCTLFQVCLISTF